MSTPLWLQTGNVRAFLELLVDRLDGASADSHVVRRPIRLSAKTFPPLFSATLESEKEEFWEYLEQMETWGWLKLHLGKSSGGKAKYEQEPRVSVLDEVALRNAIGRPERLRSHAEAWSEAVCSLLQADDATKRQVARFRIDLPNHEPKQLVPRLNLLRDLVDEPLLLREVSAKLFWGNSKVLDGRQDLIALVLGRDECPFPEAPVQLLVFLPAAGWTGVLFIENQATYERAIRDERGRFSSLALIFCAGFRGAASRLRSPNGASVYFSAQGETASASTYTFLRWLKGEHAAPSWFWGDLDFSGMRILAALRRSFPDMSAWTLGYQPMHDALSSGQGHLPGSAGKEAQTDGGATGCPYADDLLLPALRREGRFIDQETF